MKTTKLFAVTALATLAAFGAHADEADGSQFAINFNSTRSVAEVRAEAVAAARNLNTEPAGSRVLARVQSAIDRSTVRAEAASALRNGQIPRGEMG